MWQAVVSLAITGVSVWLVLRRNRWRLQIWEDSAAACGLNVEDRSSVWAWRLRPSAREQPQEIWFESIGRKGERTRIVVVVPGPPHFSEVRIRREQVRTWWAREIELGDEAFDGRFFIEGPTPLVCALLDGEARRLLNSVSAESPLELVKGTLQAEMLDHQIPEILSILLEIGRRWARRLDVAQRLAENARGDPEAGVRLRNLLVLARAFPGMAETVATLRGACSDPSPQVRLRAAQALGAEGRDVLVALAESADEDTWSAQAVSLLGQALPIASKSSILVHALRRRRVLTARACLEGLGRSGGAAAVEVLAKVLAREQGELAATAARALERTGSAAAEPPLILALEREDTDLQIAAANALSRVGTAAAVLPLKEAAEQNPYHPELRRATRQAIAAIQLRLPAATPGQLSLSGAEAGQLSLAPAAAGQLSLAADASGQLSLPRAPRGSLALSDTAEGLPR